MGKGWKYRNRPWRKPKYAEIVEEAIAQLTEIVRFAYGYDWGKVETATENTLVDTKKNWQEKDWECFVAVRHNLGSEGTPSYLWEWQPIFSNSANQLTLMQTWDIVPAKGCLYLITMEMAWCPWMWDEVVEAVRTDEGYGSDGYAYVPYQITYPPDIILSHSPIVWAQSLHTASQWKYHCQVTRGKFGTFQEGIKAHFYGGNASKVFKQEVEGDPEKKGDYRVDYDNAWVYLHKNSPSPEGVMARYIVGVWPPGFSERMKDGPGSVEDFCGERGPLWHCSVKGEDYTEGDYEEEAYSLRYEGLPDATFTMMRRQLEELCEYDKLAMHRSGDIISNGISYLTMGALYNRAMKATAPWGGPEIEWYWGKEYGPGVGWNADLSRGAGRDMPEDSIKDFGRTWVLAIEEILKCLESINAPVMYYPAGESAYMTHVSFAIRAIDYYGFSRAGFDCGDLGEEYESVRAKAYQDYLDDPYEWRQFAVSFGSYGYSVLMPGGSNYHCMMGHMPWYDDKRRDFGGRLKLVFPTKYRKGFEKYLERLYLFSEVEDKKPDLETFSAVLTVSSSWDYGDEVSAETGCEEGQAQTIVNLDGNNRIAFIMYPEFKEGLPMLVNISRVGEEENMVPWIRPKTELPRQRVKYLDAKPDTAVLLAMPKNFTYI